MFATPIVALSENPRQGRTCAFPFVFWAFR